MAKPKRVPAPARVPRWTGKRAVAGVAPAERRVRLLPGASRHAETICYRFGLVDRGGPWGFDRVDGAAFAEVVDKLRSFETMTMADLFAPGSAHGKDYAFDDLRRKNPAAYRRIVELEQEDFEQVSRLRLGGRKRLYGYRYENVFYLLWWDPEHEGYPSERRGT